MAKIFSKNVFVTEKHDKSRPAGVADAPCLRQCLDASRPWLCYWILHALDVLGHTLPVEQVDTVAAFLARCQAPEGGFGGGPGQMPHLAATYAAVSALASLGTEAAYKVIDR